MNKALKWLIRIACTLVGIVIVFLVAGFFMLNTSWLQGKLLSQTQALLRERLQTRVDIDSVSIDLFTLDAKLYGLSVEDRQQRKMLQMEFLQADVDILPLLNNELRIPQVKVEGINAELHKLPKDSLSPDTVANFQFVLDAFKSDRKKKKLPADSIAKSKKKKLELIMNKVSAERIHVKFNGDSVSLGKLLLTQPIDGSPKGKVENLKGRWERHNKKGQLVTNELLITTIELSEEDSVGLVELKRVNYKTNNHAPRKNASKPKRGFFDVGHFNLWANLKINIDKIENGTVHGFLRECTVQDTISGIDITKLQCEVTANKEGMRLEDVLLRLKETELRFVRADMKFANKKTGKKMSYFTSTINGRVILKDISRTFAPVLRNFTLPLDLKVRMEGDAEGMRFRDVVVSRPGDKLNIKAQGYITGLKNKYDLKVHFDILDCKVRGGEKERLINQFVVKKFMMKQLHALGTLSYKGSFDVLYKLVLFRGLVDTKAGSIKFNFGLDGLNKYVQGHAEAGSLKLGDVMDMPSLGPVTAVADFKFDISKPRTALMRKRLGGKLPIGEVNAHVAEASYGIVKARNVTVKIVSNGAIAEGDLSAPGKFADLSCQFSFTNTNEMKKTKVKPKVRFNIFGKKKTEAEKEKEAADKAALQKLKDEEKANKKAAKAAEKERKAAEKAARKQKEAEEDAARDAAKAKAKAEKKAAKEAKKAAKAAEKAAKKAAKEAAKAAKSDDDD